MGRTFRIARRLRHGARRRRRRPKGFRLGQSCIRYAARRPCPQARLSIPTRLPATHRRRVLAVGLATPMEPLPPRAPSTARVPRRTRSAEHQIRRAPRTPTESTVRHRTAPVRSGWTRAATVDTLSDGARVFETRAPRRLGCSDPGLHLFPTRTTYCVAARADRDQDDRSRMSATDARVLCRRRVRGR